MIIPIFYFCQPDGADVGPGGIQYNLSCDPLVSLKGFQIGQPVTDQSLVEAANLIVNKGVTQVPVVRGGELVGFLSAQMALRLLAEPYEEG